MIYRKDGDENQKTKQDIVVKSQPKKKMTVEEDAVEYLKKLNYGRESEQ